MRSLVGACLISLVVSLTTTVHSEAGPNAGAKILLHLATPTTKAACSRSAAHPACASVAPQGDLYPTVYFAYALVADADSTAGISGVEFGVSYKAAALSGIDVYDWQGCADLEFPSETWPASGGGIALTWQSASNCQRDQPGGAGTKVIATAGYFYCAAYSADTLRITTRPATGIASVASCASIQDILVSATVQPNPSPLGYAVFSSGGTVAGYSPCTGGTNNSLTSNTLLVPTGTSAAAFGFSVSTAGDFNGDGYGDVLVGADATTTGHAYIYYGGPPLNTTVDLTFSGTVSNDHFGWSVAGGGDFNGDSYPDIVIGAPYNNSAYVFLGGSTPNTVSDLTVHSVSGGSFGLGVAFAGDMNNDGKDDIVIAAPYADNGATDTGSVYVLLGGSSPDSVIDVTWNGTSANDNFGLSLAAAGDVDHDGYGDAIVGAPGSDSGGSNAGQAYIFYGGSSISTGRGLTLTGAAAGDRFGFAVGSAGHNDNDSYDDFIVGATENDAATTNAGRAYVFFGGSSPNTSADRTFSGSVANEYFGSAVALAGDVNFDGFDDCVVGTGLTTGPGAPVRIFLGGPSGDNVADITFIGSSPLEFFGFAVSSAGDVDGNGFDDVIVGAYGAGKAYVLGLRPATSGTPEHIKWDPPSFLSAPTPNPSTGPITLTFTAREAVVARLDVFDVNGRAVSDAGAEIPLPAGATSIQWNPRGLANGTYFVRARLGSQTQTRKFTVLRGR